MKAYAAYSNSEIQELSSSGGIFSIIAKKYDIVYGTAMSDDCYRAQVVRTNGNISSLRGSKYIQSYVGDAYKNIKKDVIDGYSVLFAGTGCQINGLKCYLGNEYDNLVCIDVICHGVPSPVLWEKYVKEHEDSIGKITNVNYRCKDISWKNYGMKLNQLFIPVENNIFMKMFLENVSLRPSCYNCKAKKFRMADISLGDFWGIEKIAPQMFNEKGVSLVIVRTKKGARAFNDSKDEIEFLEVDYNDCVKENPCEYKSVDRPYYREQFLKDMRYMSCEKLSEKYLRKSIVKKIILKINKEVHRIGRFVDSKKD